MTAPALGRPIRFGMPIRRCLLALTLVATATVGPLRADAESPWAEVALLPPVEETILEEAIFVAEPPLLEYVEEDPDRPFLSTYFDDGVLLLNEPRGDRFRMKVNGRIQFRHIGFARSRETWTDQAGVVRSIDGQNRFDMERARLIFAGNALSPRMKFFVQLDGDSDESGIVDFFDYWWGYEFDEAFQVAFGKRKVAASREWLQSSGRLRLVDRAIATDFFRPDRTLGIWAYGTIGDVYYETCFGDGYRTNGLLPGEINTALAFAGTSYWTPLGEVPPLTLDPSGESDLRIRLGHSWAYSRQGDAADSASLLRESDFLRLADGTEVTDVGVFAPGEQATDFDLFLYAVDFAFVRGRASLDAEGYLRWIDNLAGTGPLGRDGFFQAGYFVQGGWVLAPNLLDAHARYGRVDDPFGGSSEYTAGVNCRLIDNNVRFSFDVGYIDASATSSSSININAGDFGVLFRSQVMAEF